MRAIIPTLCGFAVLSAAVWGLNQGAPASGGLTSGLTKGSFMPVYNPQHVTGADRGTQACPV